MYCMQESQLVQCCACVCLCACCLCALYVAICVCLCTRILTVSVVLFQTYIVYIVMHANPQSVHTISITDSVLSQSDTGF